MIQLIVCDMDGTLVRDDNTISKENLTAILDVISAGIGFMLCTGRGKEDVYSALPHDLKIPAITLNGAQFLDGNGKNKMHFQLMKTIFLKP